MSDLWDTTHKDPEEDGGGGGGGGRGGGDPEIDVTLDFNGDIVTITLTPYELQQIAAQMNKDINAPGGLQDKATSQSFWLGLLIGGVIGLIAAPFTCPTTGCAVSVSLATTVVGGLGGAAASEYSDASYEDLQTTQRYLEQTAISLHDQEEVSLWVIGGNDGVITIVAQGATESIQIGSGIYYYNYEIAPYLQ